MGINYKERGITTMIDQKLVNAVLDQIGDMEPTETLNLMGDIDKLGASQGVSGFIYYKDTSDFYDANHDLIWDMLWNESESSGYHILRLISCFGGAGNVGSDSQFKNLLAWFALEQVASAIIEGRATMLPFFLSRWRSRSSHVR